MQEIKCQNCGEVFVVDESGDANICVLYTADADDE